MSTGNAPGERQRLSWEQLRSYWEGHSNEDGVLDLAADPDALGNVVWPGQPLWLNEHIAGLQVPVFDQLLDRVPPRPEARALDVGCGSGRWTRRLVTRGYRVTGIDLQADLLEVDRRRYPSVRFQQAPLQEFEDDEPYDLVSSVTVLQHNPLDHHPVLAAKIRGLLRRGGHVLILENVHDQASHVFARSIDGWRAVFEGAGFFFVTSQSYDWSPMLRAVLNARRLDPRARRRHRDGTDRGPSHAPVTGRAAQVKDLALHAAAAIDGPCERLLTRSGLESHSVHCGLLFRAI